MLDTIMLHFSSPQSDHNDIRITSGTSFCKCYRITCCVNSRDPVYGQGELMFLCESGEGKCDIVEFCGADRYPDGDRVDEQIVSLGDHLDLKTSFSERYRRRNAGDASTENQYFFQLYLYLIQLFEKQE